MGIESINHEDRTFYPDEHTIKNANISGMKSYERICRKFTENYQESWGELARELLLWEKPFTKLLNEIPKFIKFFAIILITWLVLYLFGHSYHHYKT